MTTRRYHALFALMGLLIFTLAWSTPGTATPYQVTLFPNTALVSERGSIDLSMSENGLSGTLLLPGTANPSTLLITPPNGLELSDISQKKISSVDSKKLAGLRLKRKNLEKQRSDLKARTKGLTAEIDFWESRKGIQTASSVAEMHKIASAMASEIEKTMQSVDTTLLDIKKISQEIALLDKEITAIQGSKETNWEIRLGFSPGKQQRAACTWSYEVTKCGWTPIYRVEAKPASKKVLFTWKAEVYQSTGIDWKNINLSLATGRTTMRPTPPSIRPWILQPVRPRTFDSKDVLMETVPAPRAMNRTKQVALSAPVKHAKATYAVWELGNRTLTAGDTVRIPIKKESWPAHFTYTLRPSVSTLGFLHTKITLKEAVDFPRGEAIFLADGAFLNKRTLTFSGKALDLFFGPDPLVTVKVVQNDKKAGKSGVFSKKQTWMWDWNLIVTNNKNVPVKIVVEEPKPISLEQDITLAITAQPEFISPPNTPDTMTWPLEVPPRTHTTITVHVDVQAPKGMNVDPGWRW